MAVARRLPRASPIDATERERVRGRGSWKVNLSRGDRRLHHAGADANATRSIGKDAGAHLVFRRFTGPLLSQDNSTRCRYRRMNAIGWRNSPMEFQACGHYAACRRVISANAACPSPSMNTAHGGLDQFFPPDAFA